MTSTRSTAGACTPTSPRAHLTCSATPRTAVEPDFSRTLPHRRDSVRTARSVTRAALSTWGVEEVAAQDVLLVVSELVTNAVEHAQPPVCLHVTQSADHRVVCIAVADGGPAPADLASTPPPESFDEGGRGRDVIAALTANPETSKGRYGAVHWAEVAAGEAA
ncbi:ATP-binding protein [Streptomyces sp. NPDC088729]|nr:ATP-binding protein [Streptomyces sp. ADI96-02]